MAVTLQGQLAQSLLFSPGPGPPTGVPPQVSILTGSVEVGKGWMTFNREPQSVKFTFSATESLSHRLHQP